MLSEAERAYLDAFHVCRHVRCYQSQMTIVQDSMVIMQQVTLQDAFQNQLRLDSERHLVE